MNRFIIAGLVCAMSLVGCLGPYKLEPLENIEPNETAFVIPLEEGTADQGKFDSREYLETRKVAAKRITVPVRKRDTGRGPGSFEWIPTVTVIRVDRTPVTRHWAPLEEGKTAPDANAIAVESQDAVGFQVGVNITAMIEEEDAAQFLYSYRSVGLQQVVDRDIRGVIQGFLSKEFGNLPLTKCKLEKGRIFEQLKPHVQEHFKKFGISVTSLGMSEGLHFDDRTIQANINAAVSAEMEIERAKQGRLAQEERNAQTIASAKATAEAARIEAEGKAAAAKAFAEAASSARAQVEVDIMRMSAEATLAASKRWTGNLPTGIINADNPMLLNFGLGK